jgi:tRNA uridine 5-carboxymethylaminomethyl modification enzyme
LLLRQDNADLRLSPKAAEIGLLAAGQRQQLERKRAQIREARERLQATGPGGVRWEKWLKRPENSVGGLPNDLTASLPPAVWEVVEIDVKYEGYLTRQAEAVERGRRDEGVPIPGWIDYAAIGGLKREAMQVLGRVQPVSLGQAARLPGVTPADVALLRVLLQRGRPCEEPPARTR